MTASMPAATYRFYIARHAKLGIVAVDHCTLLHAATGLARPPQAPFVLHHSMVCCTLQSLLDRPLRHHRREVSSPAWRPHPVLRGIDTRWEFHSEMAYSRGSRRQSDYWGQPPWRWRQVTALSSSLPTVQRPREDYTRLFPVRTLPVPL